MIIRIYTFMKEKEFLEVLWAAVVSIGVVNSMSCEGIRGINLFLKTLQLLLVRLCHLSVPPSKKITKLT